MNQEELVKTQLTEIEKQLAGQKDIIRKQRTPLYWIGGLLLALLIIMMVFPYYSVKLNPEPTYIPTIDEATPFQVNKINESIDRRLNGESDILRFVEPNNPEIKQMADRIITLSKCPSDTTCYAKAMFYFVQKNIQYVNDPPDDYIKPFDEIIVTKVGDCDDKTVFLTNLLQSVGISTRFVFVPEHVYVMAYLPESANKYQDKVQFGWVNLDATCENCEFGQIVPEYYNAKKQYV